MRSPSEAMPNTRPVESGAAELKRAPIILMAVAMPTALEMPWPRGPVVTSTPGVMPASGWPGVFEPSWRKRFSSSIGRS